LTLKEPDLLNLSASVQRANLLERNGVLELGIEVAQDLRAEGALQKMASHQMAAAHKRVMELMQESASASDPDIAIKMVRASARLMDAFSRAALTLDRLQRGGDQTEKRDTFTRLPGPSGVHIRHVRRCKSKSCHFECNSRWQGAWWEKRSCLFVAFKLQSEQVRIEALRQP
jgi:hypothetical protein